jgi:hypothetical protein
MTTSPKSAEEAQAEADQDAPKPEQGTEDDERIRVSPLLFALGILALGVGLLAGLMMSSVVHR